VTVTVAVYNQISLAYSPSIRDSKRTGVGILLGSDVVQLDNIAALVATLNGAVAGDLVHQLACCGSQKYGSTYGEPVNRVGVCGVASATGVLLITGTVDHDGVVDGSCQR
jgi:hypothetical protein